VGVEAERLQENVAHLGDRAVCFEADVTDSDALARAVAGTVERFGGIDVAVANAGIAFTGSPAGRLRPGAHSARLNSTIAIVSIRSPSSATTAASRRPGTCQLHHVTPGSSAWRAAALIFRCANTALRIGSTA
jgi:NAD(P)-dependent dehydrogenase (short-subunit alcohol dehydrogenase family)